MIILESLKIENYRNIKNASLKGLKDLNIFIGPNNCGKTNILKTIELITRMDVSPNYGYHTSDSCSIIRELWHRYPEGKKFQISGLQCGSSKEESHLRENYFEVDYIFNQDNLEKELKGVYPDVKTTDFIDILKNDITKDRRPNTDKIPLKDHLNENIFNKLTLKQFNEKAVNAVHISLFSIEKLAKEIQKKIIMIEDSRLQRYKNYDVSEYIRNKNLPGTQMNKLLDFLKTIIDPQIIDYKQNTLELVKSNKFVTSIIEQGSGVRSLICLAVDILSSEEGSIILIDEPELGLNPAAKQAFLKFLLKEKESKQIFITTHDPAFLNPIILPSDNVAIYAYSPIYDGTTTARDGSKILPDEPNFVNINLQENPYTFGGYLLHSESLKPIHIYVEGHKDVKNLQDLLFSHFKQKNIEDLNKFGIYHLGGGFWKHLLYTIPNKPYNSIVILDADKLEEAEEVLKQYNSLKKFISSDFKLCKDIKEIEKCLDDSVVPVYCLNKGCVEDIKNIEEFYL